MTEPDGGSVRFILQLPCHPVSVPAARNIVGVLCSWLSPEQIEDARVIISEIVTNAIRYGSPNPDDTVELELVAAPSRLTGAVRDRGPEFLLPVGLPATEQVGGFGLHISTQLAGSLSIGRSAYGNEITFTIGTVPPIIPSES